MGKVEYVIYDDEKEKKMNMQDATTIKNIYCIGRNYVLHAKELNNEVPTKPMLFSKPTHAYVEVTGQNIDLPGKQGSIHYEVELVVRIGKTFEKGMNVDEVVDSMAIGLDLTLRDVQSELKKKGHPWLLAKGFKNSAVLSPFITFPSVADCLTKEFGLRKNGELVQRGNISDMVFDLQTIIEYTAEHFGLGEGDLIFTGTPEGVGEILDGDGFELIWDGTVVGSCTMTLR